MLLHLLLLLECRVEFLFYISTPQELSQRNGAALARAEQRGRLVPGRAHRVPREELLHARRDLARQGRHRHQPAPAPAERRGHARAHGRRQAGQGAGAAHGAEVRQAAGQQFNWVEWALTGLLEVF